MFYSDTLTLTDLQTRWLFYSKKPVGCWQILCKLSWSLHLRWTLLNFHFLLHNQSPTHPHQCYTSELQDTQGTKIKHLLKGMFYNNKNQWESQSSHWGLENNKGIQYIFKTSKCQIIFSGFHFLMQCNQWAVNDWFISLSASFPVSQTGQVR